MRATRRAFLRLSAAAMAGSVLAACTGKRGGVAPPEVPTVMPTDALGTAPAVVSQRYREAPMLAEMVARGELPPVDERLPSEPFVLQVNESIGTYGGAWRRAYDRDMTFEANPLPLDGNLVYLDRDLELRPHIAESWEVNEEGTRLTWHLRRGMRWSNGDPVTSQDFWFSWFGDPNYMEDGRATAERHMDVELHDDYTFTVSRSTPSFPTLPATYASAKTLHLVPAEHAKAYHPDYAEGGAAALRLRAEEEGYGSLGAYYYAHVLQTGLPEPGTPTLLPWRSLTSRHSDTVLYERNPYYWQVDTEGQQLPYLDHVLCLPSRGEEPLEIRVANGELDYHVEGLLGAQEDAYRATGYGVQHYPSGEHFVLVLNPTAPGAALADLFQRREVRRALSLGINRAQLATLYGGGAEPRQFSPIEASPFYDEELSRQYLAYDPDRANRMLDDEGYEERDSEGYRVSPDGDRLWLIVYSPDEPGSAGGKVVAAVLADLEALGIECEYVQRSAYDTHAASVGGGLQASVSWMGGTVLPTVATLGGFSPLGPATWRGRGEFPPDHYLSRLDSSYTALILEPDLALRNALFREYLAIWKEELPVIGLLGSFQQVGIVREGLRNVLDGLVYDEVTNYEAFQRPQQFYWERPESHGLTVEEREWLRPATPGPEETPAQYGGY